MITKPIEAVLFDLDGTLIDTAPDFVTVVNTLREEQNKPALTEQAVRAQTSNGGRAMTTLATDVGADEDGFADHLKRFLTLYEQNLAVETQLFDGMATVLERIEAEQIPWGIVTNKHSRYTVPILKALQLFERSASNVCPDQVTRTKPDPEPLLLACQQMGVDPKKTVYVGDHERDIIAGRAAGMITVAALYGYINDDPAQWQANYTIEHPAELNNLLFAHTA